MFILIEISSWVPEGRSQQEKVFLENGIFYCFAHSNWNRLVGYYGDWEGTL